MSDFYQSGEVATLHSLNRDGVERLEDELEQLARIRPIALLLPALYSEFEGQAMLRIRSELARVRYLRQIVVALCRANEAQFESVRSFFDGFPQPVTLVWISGPRMQQLYRTLERNDLPAGEEGKGRACWMALGYLLASGKCDVVALHDCDILNYDRRLLARLCYPVANPKLGFEFSKGYYARVSDRLHGRVTRLFLIPLVRALLRLVPDQPFLTYLHGFRYPLAGEFAMRAELAAANRLPGDWGLELGMLAEVYRNRSVQRICQTDLTDNYEHKHQPLSEHDVSRGLMRMSCDIAKALFRTLASEGMAFNEAVFRALEAHYVRTAEDTIFQYYADARLNGLAFDCHGEEQMVTAFARSLRLAAANYLEDPLDRPWIPSWNRVLSEVPGFFDSLLDAVHRDNVVHSCRLPQPLPESRGSVLAGAGPETATAREPVQVGT